MVQLLVVLVRKAVSDQIQAVVAVVILIHLYGLLEAMAALVVVVVLGQWLVEQELLVKVMQAEQVLQM